MLNIDMNQSQYFLQYFRTKFIYRIGGLNCKDSMSPNMMNDVALQGDFGDRSPDLRDYVMVNLNFKI